MESTATRLRRIVDEIAFRDWRFVVDEAHGAMYLWVEFYAPDTDSGEVVRQCGRRWLLGPGLDRSQVVQTALLAVLAAVEHEAREDFRYRGQPVYGPHPDVEALHEFVRRQAEPC